MPFSLEVTIQVVKKVKHPAFKRWMIHEEKTLRPAIQAAFDQGGLDGICKLLVRLLNDQHPQRPCWIPLMLSSGVLSSYQKVF